MLATPKSLMLDGHDYAMLTLRRHCRHAISDAIDMLWRAYITLLVALLR